MMEPCPYEIGEILYHAPPMILIDAVTEADETEVAARVDIHTETPFLQGEEVPAYVGIEYMAQSIAAWSGIKARKSGGEPRIGYLVSTRNMKMTGGNYRIGDRLEISVRLVYDETPMAVFDCEIRRAGNCLAEARLNVYQP
ncbi:MAG: hypothetical protein EP348_11895 [Alphaproteobacteria bacterium]|nr:MAG: hypothetical protein EP348_11895 [Alphaproteobacteria bacterium]